MQPKKIFIIIGNPDANALTGRVARWYARGANLAGHTVRMLDLADAKFDPILHRGYNKEQVLEPVLIAAQEDITWAEHIVIVYPNWWGSMPALLKGFFDRVLLPEFAFSYDKEKLSSKGLLTGKTGRIILLMRIAGEEYRKKYPETGETVKHSILEFCGVHPVHMSEIGPSEKLASLQLDRIEEDMVKLGAEGK